MIKPDKAENPKIHSRRIDITTYEGDSESIVVEGVLHDERLAISYRPTGGSLPPDTVHYMIIQLKIAK